jgi:hypothetical protein
MTRTRTPTVGGTSERAAFRAALDRYWSPDAYAAALDREADDLAAPERLTG